MSWTLVLAALVGAYALGTAIFLILEDRSPNRLGSRHIRDQELAMEYGGGATREIARDGAKARLVTGTDPSGRRSPRHRDAAVRDLLETPTRAA